MIKTKKINLGQPLNLQLFSHLSHQEGMVVLHSNPDGQMSEKWTIIGMNGKHTPSSEGDIDQCRLQMKGYVSIGYLAYPNPTLKNDIPNMRFYGFDSLLHYNHQTNEIFIKYTNKSDLKKWEKILNQSKLSTKNYKTIGRLQQSVTKAQYIKKIKQIKELLAAGEVYQINYAIRFRKKFQGDPYALFLKLTDINPTDFAAYLNCGDFQIISSSPERLFKVQNGKIITQPIKGTAPKEKQDIVETRHGASLQCPVSPDKNLIELLNSEKERAELDMITDLERNDVGKICEYGTLKLVKEREVLEMKNIWHTYSEIQGKLNPNVAPKDIINAMFPGGSITGCPKKRAMEYIEKLEGLPRNIFTGSIGYVSGCGAAPCVAWGSSLRRVGQLLASRSPQRSGPTAEGLPHATKGSYSTTEWLHNWNMDFNIAIRTVLIKDGQLEFWVGGGIVADSIPEKEYAECILKAEKILKII